MLMFLKKLTHHLTQLNLKILRSQKFLKNQLNPNYLN
jgi:hypothetical protein